jgi:hypothetical protein
MVYGDEGNQALTIRDDDEKEEKETSTFCIKMT